MIKNARDYPAAAIKAMLGFNTILSKVHWFFVGLRWLSVLKTTLMIVLFIITKKLVSFFRNLILFPELFFKIIFWLLNSF